MIQNKTENKIESNQFFDYFKLEKSNKTINLYESSEVYIKYYLTFFFFHFIRLILLKCMFDLFISERNLILISFNLDEFKLNEKKVKESLLRRILKVLVKVSIFLVIINLLLNDF